MGREDHDRELNDLVQRLRALQEHFRDGDAGDAADAIEELQNAFREIYEVYAGSEGFIPETCPEAYQQQLIKEMVEIAAKHMRKIEESVVWEAKITKVG